MLSSASSKEEFIASIRKLEKASFEDSRVQNELWALVENLRRWKLEVQPERTTSKKRLEQIALVKELSTKLLAAFQDLDFSEKVALEAESGLELDPTLYVLALAGAAESLIERLGPAKTGRPSTLGQQMEFFLLIKNCLRPVGIQPAHTGLFRLLAELMFQAAGITFPDRALRAYMKDVHNRMTQHLKDVPNADVTEASLRRTEAMILRQAWEKAEAGDQKAMPASPKS